MIETCTNCGMLHIRNKQCHFCELFTRRNQWTS